MASIPHFPVQTGVRAGIRTKLNVIGALLMRELHTRYGRENIGYLWVIGEPLMLACAIALLHSGQSTHYGSEMGAVPFAVMGYCVFIMFRGMWNRAEGALEANAPLLYHKMVSPFDIMLARGILEGVGTFMCLVILLTLIIAVGLASLPARPLWLLLGCFFMFLLSLGLSLIIVAASHENRMIGRMVHPISYIMMPLSGAWFRMDWIPQPYQYYLSWFPLPGIFEMCRYGMFESATAEHFDVVYLVASCLIANLVGLLGLRIIRSHVHLH